MTSAWTSAHVLSIDPARADAAPLIGKTNHSGLAEGVLYWDMWPIQQADGAPANIAGRELWMALSAPDRGDPSLRHFEAKIRLLERIGGGWQDLGPVLPDFPVPYEREWAGSAMTDGERVSLFFTGAGTASRPGGYQQALFEAHGTIGADGLPTGWSAPVPSTATSSAHYMAAQAHEGQAGRIKAFRDPAWFRDPADGAEYLVFTASLAASQSAYNGAVGLARRTATGWDLLPPLVSADGVNNELERAHVVFHAGRYYVFWVTQQSTFAPELGHAPNGLYGMVADSLSGPYRPLNGSGLVLRNPPAEPLQAYSWFVSADLKVSSFVDFPNLGGAPVPADPAEAARAFGGVPAPLLQLAIDGDSCRLVGEASA